MTDQDKVRTVAEWCGWKIKFEDGYWKVYRPDGSPQSLFNIHGSEELAALEDLPDYLHSLNACAEFERVAKERKLDESYWPHL